MRKGMSSHQPLPIYIARPLGASVHFILREENMLALSRIAGALRSPTWARAAVVAGRSHVRSMSSGSDRPGVHDRAVGG